MLLPRSNEGDHGTLLDSTSRHHLMLARESFEPQPMPIGTPVSHFITRGCCPCEGWPPRASSGRAGRRSRWWVSVGPDRIKAPGRDRPPRSDR